MAHRMHDHRGLPSEQEAFDAHEREFRAENSAVTTMLKGGCVFILLLLFIYVFVVLYYLDTISSRLANLEQKRYRDDIRGSIMM